MTADYGVCGVPAGERAGRKKRQLRAKLRHGKHKPSVHPVGNLT
jgi:hypothetical protein